MSDIDNMFGSDSSDDGRDAADGEGSEGEGNAFAGSDVEDSKGKDSPPAAVAGGSEEVNDMDDPFAESASDLDDRPELSPESPTEEEAAPQAPAAVSVAEATEVSPSVMGGTGLSDSEEEAEPATKGTSAADNSIDDKDVFGSDSDSDGDVAGPRGGDASSAVAASAAGDDDLDPFADSDDEDRGGGGGDGDGNSLGRLSKGVGKGKGKGKKRKSGDDGDGAGETPSSKKLKGSKKKGDKGKKKKKKRKKGGEGGGEDDGDAQGQVSKKKKKKKKKAGLKKGKEAAASSSSKHLEDLGLLSSADEEEEEEEEEEEMSGSDFDAEEVEAPGDADGAGDGRRKLVRTKADDDFIDDTDDNADVLAEYNHDPPAPGSDSEAEEDNKADYREDTPQESAMNSVLKSMKRRKAQDLSTAEREQIAQEFMFKINQAAEDDEEAVSAGRPALNKLKMLKTVKATLAKKELQETFLEFDLLGVVKRWMQPYSNGQLPNLTIRKEMLAIMLMLPVQVDHLKRSGIGKVVMGLLHCKEETMENKRVLRELVTRWNRPVYEKGTSYRAMRSHDEPEAMEVTPSGSSSGVRRRRMISGNMSKRDGASRNEAVGNILSARASGMDPNKSRVPFSNGYAFAKAPVSRVEGHGRAPTQQVDTSARAKLLKKMATLSRPVNKKV